MHLSGVLYPKILHNSNDALQDQKIIYERRFIHDSYANRKGKGTHRALDRCRQFAQKCCYVLQCDV